MVTPEKEKKFYVICEKCEHKFSTDKDPNASKESNKPQCIECGSRTQIMLYKEWQRQHEDIFPDITKRLEEIMQTVQISQKKIDLVMTGFKMNIAYQTSDGLFNFLSAVGVDARKAKVTCDMFFGAQQLADQQTKKIMSGTLAQPPQMIMVDQTGKPQVIQPPQPTPGFPSQPPIIFLPSQQPQQQQIDGNKIIQRPIIVGGQVQTDAAGNPLMETIIPAGLQQHDTTAKIIQSLKDLGFSGGKPDEVNELKAMLKEITAKNEEKSNTQKIIDAIQSTNKGTGGDSDAVRALKEEMNRLRIELRDSKEDKKFQALEAKFDRRLAEIKKDHEGTKLSDEQFQIKTQEKSIGHLTEFAKELGKVVAEESGKIMGPMLEMQRTQFNAQMITQLQAMEVQTKQPPGTYTKILSPPGTVVPQKSGALTKTMQKIKERSG